MSEKAILVTLKGNKGTAMSEYMDEDEAEAELERINGELNDPTGPQFIKLGKSATVNRAEVLAIQLHSPSSFA